MKIRLFLKQNLIGNCQKRAKIIILIILEDNFFTQAANGPYV